MIDVLILTATTGFQPNGLNGWQVLALLIVFGFIAWLVVFGDKNNSRDNLSRTVAKRLKLIAKNTDSATRKDTNQFLENYSQELRKWTSSLKQAREEISTESSALLDKYSTVPLSTPKSATKSSSKTATKKKSAAKSSSKSKTQTKGRTLAKSSKAKAPTNKSAAKKTATKSVKTGKAKPKSVSKTAKKPPSKRGTPKR